MMNHLDPPDRAKLIAAYFAMGMIEDGMLVGLGTGSTAAWLVKLLGARKALEGLEFRAVSTSEATEQLALSVGLQTTTLAEADWLDLTIDGADEIDSDLMLIKGGGGALLREKIVATASDRMVVIADPSKIVDRLGEFPLPVEIVQFGVGATETLIGDVLEDLGMPNTSIQLRGGETRPFLTDEKHLILDLSLGQIDDPDALREGLSAIPGVVETGLFLDIAEQVIVGASSGEVEVLHRDNDKFEVVDLMDGDRLETILAEVEKQEKSRA